MIPLGLPDVSPRLVAASLSTLGTHVYSTSRLTGKAQGISIYKHWQTSNKTKAQLIDTD